MAGSKKIVKLAKRGTSTVATITEQVFKRMLRAYEKLLKDAHPCVVVVAMLDGEEGFAVLEENHTARVLGP